MESNKKKQRLDNTTHKYSQNSRGESTNSMDECNAVVYNNTYHYNFNCADITKVSALANSVVPQHSNQAEKNPLGNFKREGSAAEKNPLGNLCKRDENDAVGDAVEQLAANVKNNKRSLGIKGNTCLQLIVSLHDTMPSILTRLQKNDDLARTLIDQEKAITKLQLQNNEYITRLQKMEIKLNNSQGELLQKNSQGESSIVTASTPD